MFLLHSKSQETSYSHGAKVTPNTEGCSLVTSFALAKYPVETREERFIFGTQFQKVATHHAGEKGALALLWQGCAAGRNMVADRNETPQWRDQKWVSS